MGAGLGLQSAGLLLAMTTFATIAAGHVLVRRLHARFGTRPAIPLFILGGVVLLVSLLVTGNLLSGILGIIAITFIWDGIEMFRQEKRMRRERGDTLERDAPRI
jgi:hypothetical protein